jgi:hypothetical protein
MVWQDTKGVLTGMLQILIGTLIYHIPLEREKQRKGQLPNRPSLSGLKLFGGGFRVPHPLPPNQTTIYFRR